MSPTRSQLWDQGREPTEAGRGALECLRPGHSGGGWEKLNGLQEVGVSPSTVFSGCGTEDWLGSHQEGSQAESRHKPALGICLEGTGSSTSERALGPGSVAGRCTGKCHKRFPSCTEFRAETHLWKPWAEAWPLELGQLIRRGVMQVRNGARLVTCTVICSGLACGCGR